MTRVSLALASSGSDEFVGSSGGANRVGWHLVALRARREPSGWIATVRVSGEDDARAQDARLVHLFGKPAFGFKLAVLFLAGRGNLFRVRLYNASDAPQAVRLTLLPIPPFLAAAVLCLQKPAALRDAFRSVSGPWAARLRRGLAVAAVESRIAKDDYTLWTTLFDSWSEARLQRVVDALPARPSVAALVFCAQGGGAALAATLASVRAQTYAAAEIVVAGPGRSGAARGATAREYVAVLQAGEVLPRHALLLLVSELGRQQTDALLADEDGVGRDGARADPWFKPQPSLTMMCSGLLSRGVWLVRSSVLAQVLESSAPSGAAGGWAECVRLAAWFTLHAAGRADRVRRVPRLLTRRRADAEAAPAAMLAQAIDGFLLARGVQATVAPEFPLRLRWRAGELATCRVSLVVPSTLRGDTQLRCLLDVLANTTHRNFEMLVVVTQDAALDAAQLGAARRLQAAGPARVELLRRGSFNYSAANNFGASRTDGEFICLLNDDVSTLDGDWLERMVAVFSDADVGIVGARLYYPDMTTQHGGVIMGLAGLADHVNRLLPRGEPGYMWRGELDQELSVVTGACLLVRRRVFEQVGGLDEGLPTAFNDVDFCLRARSLKWSVVMAASVELIHHETLSFGRHYRDVPEQEAADVALMRARWAAVCADDPFHNPNLSLVPGEEWTLAAPPRVSLDEPCDGPSQPPYAPCSASSATATSW